MSTARAENIVNSPFQRADGSPRRVLYAEDQTTSRVVTAAMLRRMGFVVDAVEDGELALQHARHQNYDVILLDIEMPVMDGVTAARSIRSELHHCKDTPIFALSAFLADSTEASVWRDAFDNALPKPANTNELFKAMTKAIGLKDRNAQQRESSVAPANLLGALQNAVSPGSWRRLKITAAQEMAHLSLALGAAAEAGDLPMMQKCSHNIRGLALNFEAADVAEKITTYKTEPHAANLTMVLAAIDSWVAA